MEKRYYKDFYKLQMTMLNNRHNVIIFGPESSGKCEALERCIEQFSLSDRIALLTSKSVLFAKAYDNENVTCYNWHRDQKRIDPNQIGDQYNMIIIDGYCENWDEFIKSHPDARIVMAIRSDSFGDLDSKIKRRFKIIAKTGIIEDQDRIKGIIAIKTYK